MGILSWLLFFGRFWALPNQNLPNLPNLAAHRLYVYHPGVIYPLSTSAVSNRDGWVGLPCPPSLFGNGFVSLLSIEKEPLEPLEPLT